ncbi:hypothetical protein Rpal_0688 [Rhodopseudomonas palustris TIE-1]|uniref:hypothetical protein n=1 Tax=Rhodopseudomonas palustris TaxID=1076 RepID=UPI000164ACB3|nr:hypothetical protein [Rhodopseudomonas palustris]ACE99247.1 hypothetical protein Rpal_0688 [Rhodopseudomonas palustris TIE-1]
MATKKTTEAADTIEISDESYYAVKASGRFKAFGVGFGTQSETEVTGALLKKLLASEHGTKITGYSAV